MGNSSAPPQRPRDLEAEWDDLEKAFPGFNERAELYDAIAQLHTPPLPHHYLGVIGTCLGMHGRGIGTRLLGSFRDLSASDPLSSGVYLETANPLNVRFYERAGFVVSGQGNIGTATLWCMFLGQDRAHDALYLAEGSRKE